VPLFAFAMIVTFLASQAIALQGPKDRHWAHPDVWTGAIEVALGIGYFALARYLRARFRIEAAAAHQVLAQLAPVTFLTGLALMDSSWQQDHLSMAHYLGFGKLLTPWAPMLLASAIIAVMLATWVQSYFYISCGLVFLAYVLDYRIGNEDPLTWPWPFAIMTVGFLVVVVMRWRNAREQAGEDIDDVGELLIQRSRRTSSFSARDRGRAKGSAAR
jgi:hypothetical protein